jgi:hypothetical protein
MLNKFYMPLLVVVLNIGNVADEGTLFALSSLNVTSNDDFRQWLKFTYMSDVPDQNVSDVMDLYPSDPRQGSPFNTSFLNAITPQYKRSAAVQGDAVFQAPRRFFVQQRSGDQSVWVYRMLRSLSSFVKPSDFSEEDSRGMYTPFVGAVSGFNFYIRSLIVADYRTVSLIRPEKDGIELLSHSFREQPRPEQWNRSRLA